MQFNTNYSKLCVQILVYRKDQFHECILNLCEADTSHYLKHSECIQYTGDLTISQYCAIKEHKHGCCNVQHKVLHY